MSRATSIDLCVCDLVSASRFRETTTIFAEGIDDPFEGFPLDRLPAAKHLATFARARYVIKAARRQQPDIIVVQQHLPTASAIARRMHRSAAVVLQTHSFQKSLPSRSSLWCDIRHAFKRHRYARLSGIIHVSEACTQHFTWAWPDVVVPGCVVNNGLDFDIWRPARQRAQEILCVGRCAPEKGMAEAAQAVAALLPGYPDWRARFILSATDVHPEYFRRVQAAVSGLGAQGAIAVQRPFCEVKAAMEQAAIEMGRAIRTNRPGGPRRRRGSCQFWHWRIGGGQRRYSTDAPCSDGRGDCWRHRNANQR